MLFTAPAQPCCPVDERMGAVRATCVVLSDLTSRWQYIECYCGSITEVSTHKVAINASGLACTIVCTIKC